MSRDVRKSFGTLLKENKENEQYMSEKQNEVMGSKGIRFTTDQLRRCDEKRKELGISRNEFVRDAVEFYLEWLSRESTEKFLTPALESVFSAKLRDTEDRLARILFKMAIDQNILAYVYVDQSDFNADYVNELRTLAINDLKNTNGQLDVEAILKGKKIQWHD